MASYLYSKPLRFVILATATAGLLATGAPGQSHKKETGPRAIAIAELPKDSKSSPRLIPIAIRDKGRFFDASVYQATPRPLAVDTGVVYEAERSGEPVGFFTVEGARQVNGEWVALGHWQERGEEKPAKKESQSQPDFREEDDSPPVLHRGSSRPDDPAPSQSKPAASSQSRSSTKTSEPEIPPPDSDPNRPRLRRGKPPEVEHAEAEFEPPGAKGSAPGQNLPATPEAFKEVLVAISDAGGPRPEPLDFHWTADEKQQWSKKLGGVASQEIVQYAKSKPGLKAGPAATFDQAEVKAFDLAMNNNPVIVFTGRVPGATGRGKVAPADYFYYVTVVALQESDGSMRKLFSSVTDTGHLDAFPRLELIDAVDAEGNGYGNLLFRAISDTGRSYRIYRATRDTLWKLFEGGSGAT